MGYLSATANSYGEYGLTSDASAAMRISFGTSSCASSAVYPELDITAQNGLTTYPLTGFITGFSNTDNNLYSGSFNYAYFGGVATETPAGSPAITEPNSFSAASGVSRAVESAVWSWSTSTNALTPQWINTDGSFPTNYLVYVPSSVAFALLGDVTAFSSNFVNVQVVTFTFVPSSSLP
ncbi:hypothetical protein NEOLEDRAFT_651687 [Neolentinus lepideus HHB14362 ss-1]|uniref:Uncharacterized protein n=1 Tax=Neolentinus lepideus HHB14362 ss-1 TaxID=1314782 RepID=A0A165QJ43_9AGAM|nr:hypothetical protein NEOLEDRAFT_651687 [Neolentinus lepideus HHB14362 ss-1]